MTIYACSNKLCRSKCKVDINGEWSEFKHGTQYPIPQKICLCYGIDVKWEKVKQMPGQIIYTPENPPTKGVAKKIWDVFVNRGLDPQELHYNAGKRSINGSGTWACTLNNGPEVSDRDVRTGTIEGEYWCGIVGKTAIYIEGMVAPYSRILVGFTTNVCPFRYGKHGCRYPSMCKNMDNIWPEGCPKDKEFRCDTGTEEFLIRRNNEYEKWRKN